MADPKMVLELSEKATPTDRWIAETCARTTANDYYSCCQTPWHFCGPDDPQVLADAQFVRECRIAAPELALEVLELRERLREIEDAAISSSYIEASGGCDCERCTKLRAYFDKHLDELRARYGDSTGLRQ